MLIDVTKLPDEQLRNLIDNHRRHQATDSPIYVDALREWQVRKGNVLDFYKSFRIIRAAAKQRRCVSYKDLADAGDADWGKVHYGIGGHLWDLIEFAHLNGWPMLSAVVVNKPNVASRRMEPETLKGFIGAARLLGYNVTDEEAFCTSSRTRFSSGRRSLRMVSQRFSNKTIPTKVGTHAGQ